MNSHIIENPLVTVGITTYNRPNTLRQALNSVINQTYKNIEILVSDDCSQTIEVKEIEKEFIAKDKRIKFFHQSNHEGVTFNFHYVLNRTQGQYFMWLCDDDWIDKNYIEECLKVIQTNTDCVIVTGETRFYSNDLFICNGIKIDVLNNNAIERVLSFHDQELGSANLPNFGLMKTEDVKKVPLLHILGHDNVWISNFSYLGKIKTIESTSIHRRLGGLSESLKKIAVNFSLSAFDKYFSSLSLWLNLIKDIVYKSPVFKSMRITQRLYLAYKLTLQTIFNLEKYLNRYKEIRLYDFDSPLENQYQSIESL